MRRVVIHELPDGSIRQLYPFHISMEGLETVVLCRDDKDYDAMVKILCIAARRKNVIVVIYAVVSNHSHVAILAASQQEAYSYGQELKRMYAMWFRRRYNEASILRNTDVKAILLDTDWYVRNALAYIPRNALDNGCTINDYRWTGYRAMFRTEHNYGPVRRVAGLTKREKETILHTGDDLSNVPWLIDSNNELIPDSFCEHRYLEQAFEGDPAFFLKTLGGQNSAEMHNKLIDAPRQMQTDGEFYKQANETCQRWFQTELSNISEERKMRLIPYLFRTTHTTIPQLSRVIGLSRSKVTKSLGRKTDFSRKNCGDGLISDAGPSPKILP